MKEPMQFTVFSYADVSTVYLMESDLELLATVPNHLAETDDGKGTFLYLPDLNSKSELAAYCKAARRHGMSARFVKIIREIHRQGIAYARFDADGGDI